MHPRFHLLPFAIRVAFHVFPFPAFLVPRPSPAIAGRSSLVQPAPLNGAAIPLSTFSLSLPLFWTITTTAEASPSSGPRSRFRNWDISVPSSLLRIHGRHDCSLCTRILCLASSLTSSALSSIGAYYTTFAGRFYFKVLLESKSPPSLLICLACAVIYAIIMRFYSLMEVDKQ